MDKELLEALGKILDEKLDPIKNDVQNIKNDVQNIKNDVQNIKNDVQKNSLLLEDINKKVEVIAEVQTAFKEQMERVKDKDGNTLAVRFDIVESAVKDTSSRVKDIQKDLTRVVRATGENWAEIVELKAVK